MGLLLKLTCCQTQTNHLVCAGTSALQGSKLKKVSHVKCTFKHKLTTCGGLNRITNLRGDLVLNFIKLNTLISINFNSTVSQSQVNLFIKSLCTKWQVFLICTLGMCVSHASILLDMKDGICVSMEFKSNLLLPFFKALKRHHSCLGQHHLGYTLTHPNK